MRTTFPEGFLLRAPNMDDLEAVTELINACDRADFGEDDTTIDDVLVEWHQGPGFELATDARLVIAPSGQIVGYTDVCHDRLWMFINPNTCVHPDYRDQGIESYLFELSEARARQYVSELQEGERPLTIRTVSLTDTTRLLLEQKGYVPVKHEWRMEILMEQEPAAPEWPEGITTRPFVPGQDNRTVHAVIQVAFRDLAGHIDQPFEEWEAWALKRDDFDPSLLYLATQHDKVIGVALCYDYPDTGWVRQLSVLRPWRGRGVGMQLLRQAFSEFYRRGKRKVGLVVDSQNATGATRLYERAGMHIALQQDTYEKELHV